MAFGESVGQYASGVSSQNRLTMRSDRRSNTSRLVSPQPGRKKLLKLTKTPQQVGVHRDCFGCGRTCEECKVKYIRTCRYCRAEYCVIDNEGSSETEVRANMTLAHGSRLLILPVVRLV
jgi:hypothetical protein